MTKRLDYLSWNDYFMDIAILSAKRSKDPNTQVGACIVNKDKKVVGIGYNGMPAGKDDKFPWSKDDENSLNNKYLYVVHAEPNALTNANQRDLTECVMFVTLFPCNECAKLIVQSGIRKVYYYEDKYKDMDFCKASKIIFDTCGVEYQHFIPEHKIKLE